MIRDTAQAAFLIFLAEMGDKTQLLAMAFALRFSISQVLGGVAAGAFFNHGLAVILGSCLAQHISLQIIRPLSAVLFLAFGLWGLFFQTARDERKKPLRGNPVLVVAIAFFIGELGDKTQLTAIVLASGASHAGAVLAGTVLGMVLTSLVGILIGIKLGERIPVFTLRLLSSGVFIGFGLFQLIQAVPMGLKAEWVRPAGAAVLFLLLILLFFFSFGQRGKERTALKEAAGTLQALDSLLEELCLNGKSCRGSRCPLGYCKSLIKAALAGERNTGRLGIFEPYCRSSQCFDQKKVEYALALIETLDLEAGLYRELKANLEKLNTMS